MGNTEYKFIPNTREQTIKDFLTVTQYTNKEEKKVVFHYYK